MRSGRLVTLAAGLVVLAMLVMVVAQAAPAKPVQRARGPAAGGGCPGLPVLSSSCRCIADGEPACCPS